MGSWYDFTCEHCEYRAKVSGGPDQGFYVYVHTAACATCNALVDAHRKSENDGAHVALDYVCPRETRTRKHTIELWTHPGPCPKCGHTLTRGDDLSCWD